MISTVAGNAAMGSGYTGDGGQATAATLSGPIGLAVDAVKGAIYIVDKNNNVVRMVMTSTGIITTVVGNGMGGYGGDGGQATSAMLSQPYGVAIDTTSGTMYIADTFNSVIRNVIGSASVPSGPSASPIARPSTAVTLAPTSSGEI
jgi:DNA-binding beta-propeller fold protein YncE